MFNILLLLFWREIFYLFADNISLLWNSITTADLHLCY